jgi:hypothetical protein
VWNCFGWVAGVQPNGQTKILNYFRASELFTRAHRGNHVWATEHCRTVLAGAKGEAAHLDGFAKAHFIPNEDPAPVPQRKLYSIHLHAPSQSPT